MAIELAFFFCFNLVHFLYLVKIFYFFGLHHDYRFENVKIYIFLQKNSSNQINSSLDCFIFDFEIIWIY